MSLGKHAVLVVAALLAFAVCVTLYIRFTRTPSNVAYVSEEDGGISVIDLNTLKVVKKVHPKNVAPRGIAITFDGDTSSRRTRTQRTRRCSRREGCRSSKGFRLETI